MTLTDREREVMLALGLQRQADIYEKLQDHQIGGLIGALCNGIMLTVRAVIAAGWGPPKGGAE